VDLQLDQHGEVMATHELGHTLGFRHEHTRPASDSPAGGDVDGGRDDIIVGAEPSGHVKAFDGTTGAEIASFFAFPGFNGGVSFGAGNDVFQWDPGDGSDVVEGQDADDDLFLLSKPADQEARSSSSGGDYFTGTTIDLSDGF
jgi:hypothetical protein